MNRRWALALALASALLPLAAAGAATDRPDFGFPTAPSPYADSGWLGARRHQGHVVYRIDPGVPGRRTPGFRPARWVVDLTGRGATGVSRRDTARAAWIVAKFGAYRVAGQAAAVEVALDHLLWGGRWALHGSRTDRRLAATGAAAAIRDLAADMLRLSARYAGPYRITVQSTHPAVGPDARTLVTVRVAARRTGAPVEHLPVSVGYPGQPTVTTLTNGDGLAAASFPAGPAGPTVIAVRVRQLPSFRIQVLAPTNPRASRIVVAHRKTRADIAHRGAVRAVPSVSVATAWGTVIAGTPLATRATLSQGYPSPRTATVVLHAPATAPCAGTAVATVSRRLFEDGTYRLPDVVPLTEGWYDVGVSLPGDTYNLPASTCGARTKVVRRPVLTVSRPDRTAPVGRVLRASATATAYSGSWDSTATFRLWGPFGSSDRVRCADRLAYRAGAAISAGRPAAAVPGRSITRPGWYGWSVTTAADSWDVSGTSVCRQRGSLVHVTS